jgi:hypothetical protein
MTKAPGYSGNPQTLRIEERRASTQNHPVTRLPGADRAPARVEPDTLQDGVFHTKRALATMRPRDQCPRLVSGKGSHSVCTGHVGDSDVGVTAR